MTAIPYVGGLFRGTAAERAAYTTTNLRTGWIWIETDTFKNYFWNGSTWNLMLGYTSPLAVNQGGTGAATLTGILKGNGTSAVTASALLAVADGGTGAGTLTGVVSGNGTSAMTASNTLTGVTIDAASNTVKVPFISTTTRAITAGQKIYTNLQTSGFATSEATVALPVNFTFAPKLLTVIITGTNSNNHDTVVTLRDDASPITNATVTILTTDTVSGTTKTSSAVTAVVASGSKITWEFDNTGGSTGSCTLNAIVEGYIY